MDKKKILQLRSSIGFFGAENVIAELVSELVSTKYKPILGVFRNQKNPHLELVDFGKKNNIKSEIFKCQAEFDLKAGSRKITVYSFDEYGKGLYSSVDVKVEKSSSTELPLVLIFIVLLIVLFLPKLLPIVKKANIKLPKQKLIKKEDDEK